MCQRPYLSLSQGPLPPPDGVGVEDDDQQAQLIICKGSAQRRHCGPRRAAKPRGPALGLCFPTAARAPPRLPQTRPSPRRPLRAGPAALTRAHRSGRAAAAAAPADDARGRRSASGHAPAGPPHAPARREERSGAAMSTDGNGGGDGHGR